MPRPVGGVIHSVSEISIFETTGKLVEKIQMSRGQAAASWLAKNHSPGIYLLKARVGNQVITKRLVLQ